ncbi:MAG: hypothetical protein A2498_02365 [Lentisphaerae bacterium RIFOXYC12_FULL_60_16]|nr:MAG: hypothetical protein A2498_02365 [Lentisphaerae bacterium RIFOXYC12_FULL_60_16]OGV76043.1 MAG: hypothetical protein A2340_10715 [Lentisphaerae bacterium RIFOXYB12_FULL_60_10]
MPRETIEARIGRRLVAGHQRLAVAESCTGGMLGARLTAVAGSSAYFCGGVIAYANDVKRDLLGVSAALLARAGAVSEPVARAMVRGACRRLGSDWAVSITGVAGPGGGSPGKPVGTVWIAIGGTRGGIARRFRFRGSRSGIRRSAVDAALRMLNRQLN